METIWKRIFGERQCPFCTRPLEFSDSRCAGCNREVAALKLPLIILTFTILAGVIVALIVYVFFKVR
jgi:hypothetical protein